MTKHFVVFALILFLGTDTASAQGNMPTSREATFIEANGSAEVLVRAKGIGGVKGFWGFDEEKSLKKAEMDARKAAAYFVLYGGAGLDGLLRSDDDKRKFSTIENEFFDDANIQKFISWEASTFESRVKMAGGEKLKIEKQMRVNKKAMSDQLVARHIIASIEDITEQIGLPTLMALPEVKPGQNPLDRLKSDSELKQGASVIESYLTAKKYNVIAPDQAEQIFQQQKAQLAIKGAEEDLSYAIALSVGSDVYVTYTITVNSRRVGSTDVRKASVSVRAYETTTARLLGTETGYSEESAAPATALVEAAISNALDNVMSRINSYWQDDIKNGMQYKVIITVTGKFDEDTRYDLADAVQKTLKKLCNKTKQNVSSDQTFDYVVWVTNPDMQNPTGFFREMRKEFNANFSAGKLHQVNLNRKLMMVSVE
jgi:hypothetical protein